MNPAPAPTPARLLLLMDASKPSIRFCINNPRTLAERQGLFARGIPSRDCLGNCTACFEGRFLEIEGEIIPGDSYEDILNSNRETTKIENKSEKNTQR